MFTESSTLLQYVLSAQPLVRSITTPYMSRPRSTSSATRSTSDCWEARLLLLPPMTPREPNP